MPASKRRTDAAPRQRARDDDEGDGQDRDGGEQDEQETPTPQAPGEPRPAVPAPGQDQGYSPVLPPLGTAISEAREADGDAAAEQLARPSAGLASIRQHLAKLTAALEKLQGRDA